MIPLTDFGVNVTVYSGKVTRNELIEYYRTLDPATLAAANRWISYIGPSADLSEIDVAALAEMTRVRRIAAAKLRELQGDEGLLWAIVCDSRIDNRPIVDLWISYLQDDPARPWHPVVFTTLEAALDWLGLPDAAGAALARAVAVKEPVAAEAGLAASERCAREDSDPSGGIMNR